MCQINGGAWEGEVRMLQLNNPSSHAHLHLGVRKQPAGQIIKINGLVIAAADLADASAATYTFMNIPEHLSHLIQQIGPQMDLDEVVAYTEENFWLLQGGDEVLMEITWVEDRQTVVFSGLLGTIPEENTANVHAMLLHYNYAWESTGGCRMAVDPNDGEVVLLVDHPVVELDLPTLQEILGGLLSLVPIWRAAIQAPVDDSAEASSTDLNELPPGGIRI